MPICPITGETEPKMVAIALTVNLLEQHQN
jgi:hypothetical protein